MQRLFPQKLLTIITTDLMEESLVEIVRRARAGEIRKAPVRHGDAMTAGMLIRLPRLST